MRPIRVLMWGCALAALMAARPAQAGWNNVFQVCCNSCGSQPTVAMASPIESASPCQQPCQQPCQTQSCKTTYVQRSYYQPVTTYKQSFYYEPVTSYKTSYYYEPVTSYRYSCYYDPCTCSYQQVAQPTTSYRLRSQCCPVTSYLQRCQVTPVTTYQQMNYYEPQTTCCTTTTGAPVASIPQSSSVVSPTVPTTQAPPVAETRQPGLAPAAGAPNVAESREPAPADGGVKFDRSRQPQFGAPIQITPNNPAPAVRRDRIASRSSPVVQGTVVSADQKPLAGARLLFVSTGSDHTQIPSRADNEGNFEVKLPAGSWLLYTTDATGKKTEYKQKVTVQDEQTTLVKLVSSSR